MIQDMSGSWYIKETGESMTRVDLSVPLMYHDAHRSWTTDSDPDHTMKGTHSKLKQSHRSLGNNDVHVK